MQVEEIFWIPGRGPLVCGVLGGVVQTGDAISLRSPEASIEAVVAEICFPFSRIPPQSAQMGESVALLLTGDQLDHLQGSSWLVYRRADQDFSR